MSEYTEFFLNSRGGVVMLELLEIDHPSFAQPFRYVRNDTNGVTVTHDGAEHYYEYQPMQIDRKNVTNDLDQKLSITLADMSDDLQNALDAIDDEIKPSFKYRVYRDDDLTQPLNTLQTLEIATSSKDASALITFEAQAVELNISRTGEVYSFDRFPMLRAML